jgi:hypothetical protein
LEPQKQVVQIHTDSPGQGLVALGLNLNLSG